MSTRDKLITEAARLLDAGGNAAVTLRAVAQAVGVSHNAPYRHFKDRAALLSAIAERDFHSLTDMFRSSQHADGAPIERLTRALTAFICYGRDNPARYRLLFGDPDIRSAEGTLENAALETFSAFEDLVKACQKSSQLPGASAKELTGLIYAAVHGLIDLESSGRMGERKGLSVAEEGVALLLRLLGAASR
ncbi:TetR/AcrR family transcriptional regulator [Pelagibacterium sp. H642]|uniref:TetR/AcrR family transcriptional regulator n=1 Tax=Pelagibacterium sp. H642 TaxID=1881069 RepID=UPI0028153065|nr:TetR/AcrR family transcriptional regulator [Pelagibacterium sp. H642]WMT91427.1 TetR/AcrR family transcriptional regulator [Pelagibacterium sp. H642]